MTLATPPLARIRWSKTYRIVASRYPPIDLYENVADPPDWEALQQLEMLTNPRVRQEWGDISLVPVHRRVAGPGATYVMAAFALFDPRGSRFSDGTFGAYYASHDLATAIRETVHHMSAFYASTNDPPHRENFRTLLGSIDARLHDIRGDPAFEPLLDPDDTSTSKAFGRGLRDGGSNGIVFPSVRHAGGENFAAFWPDVVAIPVQERHLQYLWNGAAISKYFDYSTGERHSL
jgi:hypothetical protein